ncbi:transglycosylase domain-containing protein [Moorella sulfitireducens]|uniref:transglycosylase domain-containing protein n=1 Tax=Neomoorella sulfitireducens TaxID=2972948 RepID=UPI0021AC8605|nr:PBP1A family penicillin-binding protein [Moorella sulfitireducens]
MASSKKRRRKLNVFRALLLALLVLVMVLVGAGAGFTIGVIRTMPDWQPDKLQMAMTTFIYDKDGQLVEELHGEQNRIIVPLEQIPGDLQNAVIAIEDARFHQHYGVDLKAILRALWINLRSGSIREGGSTITQQLAKNAFIEKPERTLKRKIQEALMALKLERTYTKEEILESYLNIVYLGPGTYGVEAASRLYFGKSVSNLNLAECAMLAGLIQSPANYDPRYHEEAAKNRQVQVLNNMVKYGYITPEQAEKAREQKLEYREAATTKAEKFPYFIDAVIDEAGRLLESQGIEAAELYRGGLKIYTTLDPKIQAEMEKVYADKSNFPTSSSDRLVESAMVVLDPTTGEVRGVVGGRDYTTRRGFNRAIQAERQPGSTIKPLVVYGPALEKGYPPAFVIDDVPVTFPGTPKPFSPVNYDGRYRGLISMREAVRWSVNIPAVKMLNTIGIDTGLEFGRRLGLPLKDEDRNLALALGGLTTGVSPLQMAAAYGAFANQGIYITPHFVTKITDRNGQDLLVNKPQRREVMSEQVAYLMTDILETVVMSGTGTNAQIGRPVAGKTGTTSLPDTPEFKGLNGQKDAWFVAYTPELVGAVWMGYDQTDAKHYLKNVAGGGYPALIWKKVIGAALKGQPVKDFPRPGGIIYADVDAKSGLLPSDLTPKEFIVKEIFTQNMLPQKISDVWFQAEVCTTSGQLASPNCPDVTTGVFLKRPDGYNGPVKPEDAFLEAPAEVCTLHGGGDDSMMGQVSICTDPRHNGELILANIPEPGESGGCPSQYIKHVKLPPEKTPTQYCNLPDHQISKDTSGSGNQETGPPAPNLTAHLEVGPNVSQPKVILRWELPEKGDFLFSIERSSQGSNRKSLAIVKDTTYTDTSVKPGFTYRYRVIALEANSKSGTPSNEVTIAIPRR